MLRDDSPFIFNRFFEHIELRRRQVGRQLGGCFALHRVAPLGGDLGDRRQHESAQMGARMRQRWSRRSVADHSMVVDQIEIGGIAALEAHDEPPIAGDAQAPESGQVALQGMDPPSGESSPGQLLRPARSVHRREHAPQPGRRSGGYAARIVAVRHTNIPEFQ